MGVQFIGGEMNLSLNWMNLVLVVEVSLSIFNVVHVDAVYLIHDTNLTWFIFIFHVPSLFIAGAYLQLTSKPNLILRNFFFYT